MTSQASQVVVHIRAAVPTDATGIAAVFLDSSEHHAHLDPARYRVPARETVLARYGDTRPRSAGAGAVTLIAECGAEIVGFVDARCESSADPMHRDVLLCLVAEIAVSRHHRSRGIGAQLLRAAEEWGRAKGAAFAVLEYHAANTRAGAFYRHRMGYTVAAVTAIKPL